MKKKSVMVVNTLSGSQANRRRRSLLEQTIQHNPNPGVQNNLQPLPLPPLGVETRITEKASPQSFVTTRIIEGRAQEELPFPSQGCLTT
jgi:hypothetical protein